MNVNLAFKSVSAHGVQPITTGNVNAKPAPGQGGGVSTFGAAVKQKKTEDR